MEPEKEFLKEGSSLYKALVEIPCLFGRVYSLPASSYHLGSLLVAGLVISSKLDTRKKGVSYELTGVGQGSQVYGRIATSTHAPGRIQEVDPLKVL